MDRYSTRLYGYGWKNAYLLFLLDSQSAQNLELIMQVQAAIHPERLTQGAEVYVNDIFMEKWKFSEEKNEIVNKRLSIPRNMLKKTGLLTVRIKVEAPIYSNESGVSSSKYSPGIYLYWLQLNPTGE